MAEYEMVREIKNLCRNNQMRDVLIEEIETDDPVDYVRRMLKGQQIQIAPDIRPDGSVRVDTVCDGLMQTFLFTPF